MKNMTSTKAWVVLMLLLLTMCSFKNAIVIVNLETRLDILETALLKAQQSTVEIQVERVYDEDMAQWGYRMIALELEEESLQGKLEEEQDESR